MVLTPSVECPYAFSLAALDWAAREKARVEWHEARGAFRFMGASPALERRLRLLSGVTDLDAAHPDARTAVELAAAFPSMYRVKVEGATARVVYLQDPNRLALVRLARATSRAAREVLCTPAALFRELPTPVTLTLERTPSELASKTWGAKKVRFVFSTSRAAYLEATSKGAPGFVARELEAAALAVEVERAWPRDLDQWLANKGRGDFMVTKEKAGALDVRGVTEATRPTWVLGRVLDALEVELVDVVVHGSKGGA